MFVPMELDVRRNVVAEGVDTREVNKRSYHGHQLHRRNVDYSLQLFGRDLLLQLELYEDLIHPRYQLVVQTSENVMNVTNGVEHCYYKGAVVGEPYSLVAISTCNGFVRLAGRGVDGWLTPVCRAERHH